MCDQCEVLYINGVKCHEIGCPDAWRDYERSCKWCDADFMPQEQHQLTCSPSCAMAFGGLSENWANPYFQNQNKGVETMEYETC